MTASRRTTTSGLTFVRTDVRDGRYFLWRCTECNAIVNGSSQSLYGHERSDEHQKRRSRT